jgi:hypothetical protein
MNDEKFGIAPLKAEHGIHRMSWTEPTLQLAPAIQFAEGGPLQKLVLTFLSATAGLGAVFDAAKYPNFHQDALGVYRGTVREETRIDLPGVVIGVRAGALQANEAVTELCRMLAVAAWEVIKVWPGADIRNPVLQYLRHVRNAAAHNTAWHFLGEEPRHPAVARQSA